MRFRAADGSLCRPPPLLLPLPAPDPPAPALTPGQLPPDAGARAIEPAVVTAIKERRPEDTDAAYDHLYPTRQKTKVSDFTRRLRAAEEQHAADEEMSRSNTEAMARAREDTAAVAAAVERAKKE